MSAVKIYYDNMVQNEFGWLENTSNNTRGKILNYLPTTQYFLIYKNK